MISIIVPVYNTEQYLDRCIQSVLAQTYTNWELLLIDDGSTDSSGAICDKYAAEDNRIRVFHKENGGVSSARNLGLDNAKGEWITFVDSDDWVDDQYIEFMVSDQAYDFVSCYYQAIGWSKWVSCPPPEEKYTQEVLNTCVSENLMAWNTPWAKRFRTQIIQANQCKFNESISFGEDAIFVYKYLRHIKSAKISSKILYYYDCSNLHSLGRKHINWKQLSPILYLIIETIEILEADYKINLSKHKDAYIRTYVKLAINHTKHSYNLLLETIRQTHSNLYVRSLMQRHQFFTKKRWKILSMFYNWHMDRIFALLFYFK